MVRWPKGAEVPAPLTRADHLFVVREGRIALFQSTEDGVDLMTSILDEGSVYSTLGMDREPVVMALEDSAVSPLSGRAIEGLIARYPRLGRNIATVLSERITGLSETIALVSEMRVEDRLRARLHQLADRFGVTATDGVQLRLELTHAQWASLVGASRRRDHRLQQAQGGRGDRHGRQGDHDPLGGHADHPAGDNCRSLITVSPAAAVMSSPIAELSASGSPCAFAQHGS